jgi:choline-sulfatase
MDEAVGRMLGALDDNGLAENTIVIFTSDHGDNLGSHGLVQKGGPTAESVHIPMVVRWPAKLRAGRVIDDRIASLVDLAPTLISLAGGESQDHMHGRDLSGLLLGSEELGGDNYAFIETSAGVGIHTPQHLYFLQKRSENWELEPAAQYFYDLQNDPYQLENLAGTTKQANTAQVLDSHLRQWHASIPYRQLADN